MKGMKGTDDRLPAGGGVPWLFLRLFGFRQIAAERSKCSAARVQARGPLPHAFSEGQNEGSAFPVRGPYLGRSVGGIRR